MIFRREKERNILAAELLNTYQADIDAIHQQVGLRLQTVSEQSGGTEALLPQEQFAQLVEQRLTKEGHTSKEGERLKQEIIDAAMERLVFLVAPQEDKVGFEIRSLQEFMAAECLMNGSDEDVRRRLRAIAPAAHWRNVFLFAAGRCFHDKQHLRDSLHALCCELNEGDGVVGGGELEKAVLSGSRLALDILEDGAVANQPAQMKLYVRLALRLLELPPCIDQPRLAKLYQPEMAEIFQTEIEHWLAHEELERRFGAWQVLLQLISQDVSWAQFVGEKYWPEDAEAVIQIVKVSDGVGVGDWLVERWLDAILRVSPAKANLEEFQYERSAMFEQLMDDAPEWLRALLQNSYHNDLEARIEGDDGERFCLTLQSVFGNKEIAILPEEAFSAEVRWEWSWLVAAQNFSCDPSKEQLAELLSRLVAEKVNDVGPSMGLFIDQLPWPIRACVVAAKQGADLVQLKDAALSGILADHDDWQLAEQRWQELGVIGKDFFYGPEAGLPFDQHIADVGFPFIGSSARYSYGINASPLTSIVETLFSLLQSLSTSPAKLSLAHDLLFLLEIAGKTDEICGELSAAELCHLLSDVQRDRMNIKLIRSLSDHFWRESESINVLIMLGGFDNLRCSVKFDDFDDRLEKLVMQHSTEGGLWRLMAATCVYGYRPNLPGLAPNPTAFSDPRYQVAALLVQLAQTRWNETEAVALAEQLATLGKTVDKAIIDTLSIIEEHEITGRAVELFLVALFNALPPSAWQDRRNVVKAMQEQQRRRLSDTANL
ncbi:MULTISPECIES: hypothetical protein [Methylobacter]